MHEYLDPSDIANNAMMLGQTGKTIVIVEGITDRRLYGKFMDPSVEVVIAHSKNNVVGAVKLAVKRRKCEFVIGIVDADLDHIKESWLAPQLFVTDTRDSETLMMKSDAFDDVMAEYGDEAKVRTYERRFGNIRENVVKSGYPLGIMMYLSDRYGWKLCFKNLEFSNFIQRDTMGIDVKAFLREVASISSSTPGKDAMAQLLDGELQNPKDPWIVCRGHDVMEIMAIGLKEVFGSFNCKHITGSALSGSFRLAFDKEEFSTTKLYKDTKEWSERTNHVLWKVTQA